MTLTTIKKTSPKFLLSTLSAVVMAASLSGCLSSGGGSSSDDIPPAAENPTDYLTVATTEGEVRGISLNNIRVFRGIPYAAPPVGELRFAATQPAAERSDVLELSEEFGNDCPQVNITTRQLVGAEDCLYLNVYTPAEGEDLPVMVWIHGGAFTMGSGGGEYDPTRLVAENVIVVTLNYRLGQLGFMAHPAFEEDGGNFGLMDQQQALRWVKENISAFGGNPEMVTLFGESAGGHSVMSHVVSPRAKEENLFQRAIVQSGSYAPFQIPKAVAQLSGLKVSTDLDCDAESAASCLREAPVAALLAAQGSQSMPTVDPDTNLLPASIKDSLDNGAFNTELDIMIGSNQDEGTLFVALDEITSQKSLEALGENEYRDRVSEFLKPYSLLAPFDANTIATNYLDRYVDSDHPYSLALSALWTDFMFACNSSVHAGTFARSSMNTFQYWFRDEQAPWTMVPPVVSFPQKATHAGEIPYVLYDEELMRERYSGTDEDVDSLAETMVGYWTSFAKTGDPNTADGVAPDWPQVSSGQIQQLEPSEVGAVPATQFLGFHQCGYWADPPLTK